MEARGKIDHRVLGDPGTAAFSVAHYPFYQLNRVVSRYTVVIEARLRAIGLDVPGWRVLMILGERAPRRIGEIAQDAVIPVSTMTRIIGRMARAGLVRQGSRDGDARVRELCLTAAGTEMLARARAATAPVYGAAIEGFSEAEFVHLLALLGRMHDNLESI
jgi:DNA-binding MarR family transcriptional regulator